MPYHYFPYGNNISEHSPVKRSHTQLGDAERRAIRQVLQYLEGNVDNFTTKKESEQSDQYCMI